ncbi:MAG: sulfotransferase [Rhizobium sp.]|nr:sulfotransferase [Rhizobium sp.]
MNPRSANTRTPDALQQPRADAAHGDPAALRAQARSAAACGDRLTAVRLHIAALEFDPANAEGYFELGTLLFGTGQVDAAISVLDMAAQLAPGNPQVRHNLGLALAKCGDAVRARSELAESVRLAPNDATFLRALALLDLSLGKSTDAEAGFRQLIACDPADTAAHRNLARLSRYAADDPHIAQMEMLLHRGVLTPDAGIDLGFALFDALAKAGQYERAFDRLGEANRLRRQKFPYDASVERVVFEQMAEFFDPAYFDEIPSAGSETSGPIFIIGMPRAGTTLVEQILASHPDIAAGGESVAMTDLVRRFLIAPGQPGLSLSASAFSTETCAEMRAFYLSAVRHVAGQSPCFTDKMPLNFRWVGIIAAILPEARFVHCRREPVETCFSIHSSFFASGGNRYSHDLDDLADYYRQYRGLMAHWHAVLPGRILDVDLADVVADQEGETRWLLAFLGLDFDPRCMAFHANGSPVSTLSSLQVKRPVYGGHSDRLRPYLPFLEPLLALREDA